MTRPKPDPDLKDPEYIAYATLFNDITHTNLRREDGSRPVFLFSTRQRVADHLWDLGYRKESARDGDE